MQHNICLALFAFLLSTVVSAQSSTIILNQKISAKVSGVNKSYQIQAANQPATQFEITIQNGDGLNYFPQVCSGNFVQRILCKAENLVKAVYVEIDRPDQLEVKINNVLVANRSNFPQQQGQLTVTRTLANAQNLTVFAKGLPTSDVTIKVKKFSTTPNQLPIARFDFNTANDIEPSVVSFSALLSSDNDGSIVSYNWNFGDSTTATGAVVSHTYESAGSYDVSLTVTDDRGGQHTLTKSVVIRPDTYGPQLSNIQPANNTVINGLSMTLSGDSDEALSKVEIKVNNEAVQLANLDSSQKHFSLPLSFQNRGAKNILITAYDLKNNASSVIQNYTVNFNNAPEAKIIILSQSSDTVPSMIWFSAEQSTDPDGDQLTYSWDFSDVETSTEEKPTHLFKEAGSYTVTLTINDGFGGTSEVSRTITLQNPVLPEDPVEQAPPLSQDSPQSNEERFEFLFTGADPIQKNVDVTKIEGERLTPIRGKILQSTNTPVEAVKVTVKDHPEYGYTLTRADGMWDLAINGGGTIIVEFSKSGYIPSARQVDTENNIARNIDDVFLVEVDEKKTVVSLNSTEPQIHEATVSQDSDGSRKAQVLIPENTTAEIILPDGSRRPVEQITVRATEVTVGEDGPKRMPANLPPRTGYTYAADFTADEAIALGGGGVEFSQFVPVYVENFLNIPVGMAVPVGYLNPKTGFWEQMPDGVVLKVLNISNERAEIDFKGLGQIITEAEKTMLGITESELKILAQKFQVGQTFWRARTKHFSLLDLNFGLSYDDDIDEEQVNEPHPPPEPEPEDPPSQCKQSGCIIDAQRQLLDEVIDLKGLGYTLRYSTDRVQGRREPNLIDFSPFNNRNLIGLISAEVVLEVAGKKIVQKFENPQLTDKFEYLWDGMDSFGRAIPQSINSKVSVTYYYPQTYSVRPFVEGESSFDNFNQGNSGVQLPARGSYSRKYEFSKMLSSPFDIYRSRVAKQFNSWSLDILHSYDPIQKTLYKGNGDTIRTESIINVVSTIAGNGSFGSAGDGGPAKNASFMMLNSITEDAAGNIYIGDSAARKIRKINLDGIITTIAGTGAAGYSGDNGSATAAAIGSPFGIRVAESGVIYFNDMANHVTRKIDLNGIITTIAGTGVAGYTGDNGPAKLAQLNGPRALVLAKDGSIYITDSLNNVLRRVWPDGKITTFAGTGTAGFSGDGGPAADAEFNNPNFTEIDENGNIYVADSANGRIRKISPIGVITTIAGDGLNGPLRNFELATETSLGFPTVVKANSQGEIFFTDRNMNVIRKINRNGIVYSLVGTGTAGFNGDGLFGEKTMISSPRAFFIGRDDSLIFLDASNGRVRKLSNSLDDRFPMALTSDDGSEVYEFNALGLHEKTKFNDTKALKYEFIYDQNQKIQFVKDAYNRTLTISRDSDGNLQSMQGHYGQVYNFGVNQDKQLTSVTDPLSNTYNMLYNSGGLMTSFKKPEGNTSTYEYDTYGRLTKANEPNGGFKTFAKQPNGSVKMTTSENINTTFANSLSEGISVFQSTTQAPDGGEYVRIENKIVGSDGMIQPDGTEVQINYASDFKNRGFSKFPSFKAISYASLDDTLYTSFEERNYNFNPDGINFIRNEGYGDNAGRSVGVVFNTLTKTSNMFSVGGLRTYSSFDNQLKTTSFKNGDNFLATNYFYDNEGRLTTIQQGSRTTTMTYDQNGFLYELTDAEGRTTRYINDLLGRVTHIIHPNSEQTKTDYDKNSNIIGITPPQRIMHQFLNNVFDMVSSYTAPGSSTSKTYQYDSDRRLSSIITEENQPITYNYASGNNNLISINTNLLNISYSYHPQLKWLNQANSSDLINITYNRSSDLLLSKTYSGRFPASVAYAYNPVGAMQTSESLNGQSISQVFNSDKALIQNGDLVIERDLTTNLPTKKTLGNREEIISYSSYGEISSREYKINGNQLYKETYTRDNIGRITIKDVIKNSTTTSWQYTYDLKGRLKTVAQNSQLVRTYNYDANGNRLNVVSNNNNIYEAIYNGQDRLLSYTKSGETFNYSYSADDSFVQKAAPDDSIKVKYYISNLDPLQSVEIVTPTENINVSYWIDGEKRRSARLINGVVQSYFVYDKEGRLIAELNSNFTIKNRFIYATQSHSPDYMISTSDNLRYLFVKDQLGSILQVVSPNGTVVQEIEYDEFGVVLNDTNPSFQPFGYAGGHYDHETELVRFGARDYDSTTGRWLERDPIGFSGGDTNLYGYVNGDPVNKIDPNGLEIPDDWQGTVEECIGVRGVVEGMMNSIKTFNSYIEVLQKRLEDSKYQCVSSQEIETIRRQIRVYTDLNNKFATDINKYRADCGILLIGI